MNAILRIVCTCGLLGLLSLVGCQESPDTGAATNSTSHDHDHGDHSHDHGDHDHDHSDHDHDHGDHDHGHGEATTLGSITIHESTFEVMLAGEVQPMEEVHLDVIHTDGPMPAAVRLWIGDSFGTGALKVKVEFDNNEAHVHVEAPVEILDNTAVWLETEDSSQNRSSKSIPLPEA
ncbi:MAG: hypothetical protein AAF432_00265 [Planctomycetota bacterium]